MKKKDCAKKMSQKKAHEAIDSWHKKRMENPQDKARYEFMKKRWGV